MKAWRLERTGEPDEVLTLVDVPAPEPGDGQVLVRVRAAAVNFPDALLCRGQYQVRPELPFTPGVELCGEVVAGGGLAAGSRVLGTAVLPHGGFAELALMPAACALPAPESLDDARASVLCVGYQTAWFALHVRTELRAGETLLVHAAAGGVGSAAVQLGKAAGATVIGVVGGPDKAQVARDLGADIVVDRRSDDFVDVVNEATGGRGADVVFDPVGGDAYRRSTKCIAFEGRIVVVGFAGGEIQQVGLNHALVKNYSIVGLHWGRYVDLQPELVRTVHDALAELAEQGVVRPYVSERVCFDAVPDAVQRVADGATVGRLSVVH